MTIYQDTRTVKVGWLYLAPNPCLGCKRADSVDITRYQSYFVHACRDCGRVDHYDRTNNDD